MSLLTYAELTAPSIADKTKTFAQESLVRMTNAASPMPPGGVLPDISVFKNWVDSGAPPGSCGTVDAGPPDMTFTGPSMCLGTVQAATCFESQTMNPGMPCLSCHSDPSKFSPPCSPDSDTGPGYKIAGTVFALGHVPDGCVPSTAQMTDLTSAKVVITDANGVVHTLSVNSVGNFHAGTNVAFPYSAKVTFNNKTRAMSAKQTSGDCNSCHTEAGANDAPGRIALP